jgi:hypothetical protein
MATLELKPPVRAARSEATPAPLLTLSALTHPPIVTGFVFASALRAERIAALESLRLCARHSRRQREHRHQQR